jgi:hypothetical protein
MGDHTGGDFSWPSRRYAKPMTDRQQAPDDLARLRPPTVSEAEKPLRRQVAMAYRTAREAKLSHEGALNAAEAIYFKAHPEAASDSLAASARINEMIASAIQADPQWFWKNVRASLVRPE